MCLSFPRCVSHCPCCAGHQWGCGVVSALLVQTSSSCACICRRLKVLVPFPGPLGTEPSLGRSCYWGQGFLGICCDSPYAAGGNPVQLLPSGRAQRGAPALPQSHLEMVAAPDWVPPHPNSMEACCLPWPCHWDGAGGSLGSSWPWVELSHGVGALWTHQVIHGDPAGK